MRKPEIQERKAIAIEGYEKDPDLVKNGAPVGLGKNAKGERRVILVRPANSAAFEDYLTALARQYSPVTLKNDPELVRDLEDKALAGKGFIAMTGFLHPDGSEIEDTEENRLAMLLDRDFRNQVVAACSAMETFRKAHTAAALGNSPTSSSGD